MTVTFKNTLLSYFSIIFLLPIIAFSQTNSLNVSNASLVEKIYLQVDRKVYSNGDTVWFKGVIARGPDHTLSTISGVLYVELVGEDKVIFQKKIIKISDGVGQGNFDLDLNMPAGNFLIRAYTKWNDNVEQDFMFEEYIQVFRRKNQDIDAINSIKLIKNEDLGNSLQMVFSPKVIDSLQNNKLTVFIKVDEKEESLIIKKDKTDKYQLLFNVEKNSQFATVKIQTENGKTFSKTIALDNQNIDLQFFPESGELVHGIACKVGFKATNTNGKGIIVQGDIIDEAEHIITSFASNNLGMGSLIIGNVDSNKKYFARVKVPFLNGKSILYSLPKIAISGGNLSLVKQADKVLLKIFCNDFKNESVFLRISFRGNDLLEQKIPLTNGQYQSLISTIQIPEGIIAFTVLNSVKNVIAKRLFFNGKLNERLKITATTNQVKYAKRELTNINIQTTNNSGEPKTATTSLLVINNDQLIKMQQLRQNILSYFLIGSELKGNIENPSYYFQNDSIKHDELDQLLLTQGWSKYNYSKIFKKPTISPEKYLTVSGTVSKNFAEKKGKKDIVVTLLTSGKNKSIYTQLTDSIGKFRFELQDEFGNDMNTLFKTANKSDQTTSNSLVIDKKDSPLINFEKFNAVEQLDSVVAKFVEKKIKQKEAEQKTEPKSGGIVLNEVVVKSKRSAAQLKVTELYGKPNTIITGKAIIEKEKKWSFGLYSIFRFNFGDKITIIPKKDKETKVTRDSIALQNNLGTLIVIDGIPLLKHEYDLIPYISATEVTSVELIENANGYLNLYCSVFPSSRCFLTARPAGNVIAIYTKAGIGVSGASAPKGLTKIVVPVFSERKEFYAPKYEFIKPDDWLYKDARTLVHWQPILPTDNLGKATSSYYNNDIKGKVLIVVEAISENGEIGYKELSYEVKD